MVLLFLGNWRSTLIIALTIPLSILASILALQMLGRDAQPDDARRARAVGRHSGRSGDRDDREHRAASAPRRAGCARPILVGAGEIGVPAFVSTLCICVVFVPMFFLSGVARFLFVPLAEAVVFAMVASYLLSRTLVPTLVMLLMRNVKSGASGGGGVLQRLTVRSTSSSSASGAATRSRCPACSRIARCSHRCSSPSASSPACSTRCSAAISFRASIPGDGRGGRQRRTDSAQRCACGDAPIQSGHRRARRRGSAGGERRVGLRLADRNTSRSACPSR